MFEMFFNDFKDLNG